MRLVENVERLPGLKADDLLTIVAGALCVITIGLAVKMAYQLGRMEGSEGKVIAFHMPPLYADSKEAAQERVDE